MYSKHCAYKIDCVRKCLKDSNLSIGLETPYYFLVNKKTA